MSGDRSRTWCVSILFVFLIHSSSFASDSASGLITAQSSVPTHLLKHVVASTSPSMSLATSAGPAQWWVNSVFYEIFVRSFQDSNGDGIGDLNGIRQRLPQLKKLGIDALWFTPIFPSPSYHGYDATDFLSINPAYGTMTDFDHLISEAHALGIRIVLDLAVNHTSKQHPWFHKQSPSYLWSEVPPYKPDHWFPFKNSNYFATFGGDLPDLNWFSPDVRKEIQNVFLFWAARGVDGFRLDAARYFAKGPNGESDTEETHQIIESLVQETKAQYPDIYFVGEIWAGHDIIAPYVSPGQLDAAFDFPSSYGVIDSLHAGNANAFTNALKDGIERVGTLSSVPPFLTNHDMVRIGTQLSGNLAQLKLAAIAEMILPSAPYLYYGEEIGMLNVDRGNKNKSDDSSLHPTLSRAFGPHARVIRDDSAQRTPMRWTGGKQFGFSTKKPWVQFSDAINGANVESQVADPKSLWNVYQKIIGIRHQQATLQSGDFSILSIRPELAVFARQLADDVTLIVLNFNGNSLSDIEVDLGDTISLEQIIWGPQDAACQDNVCRIKKLKPFEASLFRVRYSHPNQSLHGGSLVKK